MRGNVRNLRKLFLPVCKAPSLGTRNDALAVSKSSGLRRMGYYMAAIRGMHSDTCQDTTSQADLKPRPLQVQEKAQVEEKMCPCGAGVCKVWTAKTVTNAGRKFYKCPLEKDKGQCDFFEWYDASHAHAGPFCPCGAGACIRLTAKTQTNMGREFYVCPLWQAYQSCRFFAWCDELSHAEASGQPSESGMSGDDRAGDCSFPETRPSGQVSSGVVDTCYKCGQSGHWYKDCPNRQVSDGSKGAAGGFKNHGEDTRGFGEASIYGSPSSAKDGGVGRRADPGSCFKCGFPGHWAKDCPYVRRCVC